jgi:hypothetical protein
MKHIKAILIRRRTEQLLKGKRHPTTHEDMQTLCTAAVAELLKWRK